MAEAGAASGNIISFISANFVARELEYHMTGDWGQGDRAANAYYREPATFAGRLDAMLAEVRAMGFGAIDLWTSHLNWAWATDEHLAAAREALGRHELRVISFAGGFGRKPEEFSAACRVATAVGCDLLAGGSGLLGEDRASMVRVLREHGVRYAFENHPEKTPQDALGRIGDGDEDVIGLAVDTGWFGTQGFDAARALEALAGRLMHVHLKDVRAAGAHETCRFGEGVVPIEDCVRALQRAGYAGPIGIEHEPEKFDPREDIEASLALLRGWLGQPDPAREEARS